MKNPQLYRHILSVFIWIMLVFLVIILYHYAIRGVDWDADALGKIDMLYAVARIFFITGTISSAIGAIFAYIRNSRALEMKFVKRFFPLMRFVMSMLVWVVGGFFILEALQINTKNILAGAGIGGAILALASKDLITNLMGSLSILFSWAFEIGDTIRIRTLRLWIEGMVEEITLNHTKVTNNTGEVVYVPNKTIYSESVENLSRRRFFSYEYLIPFAKWASAQEVHTALKIIEWKILSYAPIDIVHVAESPNATEYLYRITVKIPEENKKIDTEIREFLVSYIFRGAHTQEKKIIHESQTPNSTDLDGEDFTNS